MIKIAASCKLSCAAANLTPTNVLQLHADLIAVKQCHHNSSCQLALDVFHEAQALFKCDHHLESKPAMTRPVHWSGGHVPTFEELMYSQNESCRPPTAQESSSRSGAAVSQAAKSCAYIARNIPAASLIGQHPRVILSCQERHRKITGVRSCSPDNMPMQHHALIVEDYETLLASS